MVYEGYPSRGGSGATGGKVRSSMAPKSYRLGPWLVTCFACTFWTHILSVGGYLALLGALLEMVGPEPSSLPIAFFHMLIFVFTAQPILPPHKHTYGLFKQPVNLGWRMIQRNHTAKIQHKVPIPFLSPILKRMWLLIHRIFFKTKYVIFAFY